MVVGLFLALCAPAVGRVRWHHRCLPCDRGWGRVHHWLPRPTLRAAEASWYGPGDSGGGLACGGALTSSTLGVANKTLPCGTRVRVCLRGCVTVRVVDRGPYIAGREFDLTEATARAIGFLSVGVGAVRVAVG